MAHIALSSRISYARLVELTKQYKEELDNTTDVFARAEIDGYLNTICEWVSLHRGWNYWQRVRKEALEK